MAAIHDEEISDEFSMFGVELSDENVIDKVKELCIYLSKDPAGIVEEWVAFASSNRISTCDVNLENLTRFEREVEKKKGSNKSTPKTPITPVTPKVRKIRPTGDGDDILNSYASPAGKGSKRQHTPDNSSVKRGNFANSPAAHLIPPSPAAFSPANAKPSESYKSRTGSGDAISYLNSSDKILWKGGLTEDVTVNVHKECLSGQYKHMFQKNLDKIDVLDDIIEYMADLFKEELEISEFSHATLPTQEQVTIIGRIACDSNGKLNAKSVILEGSRDNSGGKTVALDLSGLKECSLFPGQVVALEGVNTSGSKFVVKKIVELPVPTCADLGAVKGPINMLVACGPFTTSDSLAYEPLKDLVGVMQKQTPDVCIIMGPFIDEKNDALGTLTDQTFDELFQQQLQELVDDTENLNTRLIFVPSSRDVHHTIVYPQPPYRCPEIKDKRTMFVSDPTILQINNITIGLTSTDSLFHLSQQEMSFGMADRIARLARHLLYQRKFYPLYPPGEDVNLDFENFITYGRLPVTPNILLLPSRLAQFAKDISGCCCVNPGTLARGKSGGSYAQIVVGNAENGKSLSGKISVKIVKI